MTDRSELLRKVLETWDQSVEGERYLQWLIKPEARELDGGDILREAVLDVVEEDAPLAKLKNDRAATSMEEFYQSLPPETARKVRDETNKLHEALSQVEQSFRQKAEHLRRIRQIIKSERIEALTFVSQVQNDTVPDQIAVFHRDFAMAEQLAAKVAALSRTSTEQINIETNWQSSSAADFWKGVVQSLASQPGEDWFDSNRENLDRYYSYQLVARLETIVERASSLKPVALEINSRIVSSLFQEAHEVFLSGFDSASIALCRSLVDHSLKDRLSVPPNERPQLQSMIEQAAKRGLLDPLERDCADKVRDAGNKIMHDMLNLRRTAQEVLDCTRKVLDRLYGNISSSSP